MFRAKTVNGRGSCARGSAGGLSARSLRRAAGHELPRFEMLEQRLLLSADAPVIESIDADNRGLVVIEVSADLREETVSADAVKIFTAGRDGLLGTADDEDSGASVSYDAEADTITVDAQGSVLLNRDYAISVDGDMIRGTDNRLLDAEFNGFGEASGDGAQGGEFLAFTTSPAQSIARVSTALGDIDIQMFNDQTPITVENFFRYADEGLYDNNFFHRSVEDFVVQGGGFDADEPDFGPIPTFDPILNEPGISNTRGTVAMAKLGGDPNSATSQWFFNLGDNSDNLDDQNGGFTVFGEVTDAEGLAVMDALAALPTLDASEIQSAFTDLPVRDGDVSVDELMAEDLALITRVTSLLELTSDPTQQLGGEGNTSEIVNPDGAGVVRVINLNGDDPGNIGAFIDVDWRGSGEIRRITLNGGFTGDIGIQITDVSEVQRFDDRRGELERGTLRFVSVEDGAVDRMELRGDIAGFDLNGVTMPGGFVFPNDIDGDGSSGDLTSVYSGGTEDARQFRSRADVTGDVVYEGSLRRVDVRGDVARADFVVGGGLADGSDERPVNIFLRDGVRDVGVRSEAPIRNIRANEWRDVDAARHSIIAPEIRNIRIGGDFVVNSLVTTDGGVNQIRANGLLRGASWSIAGDVRNIRSDGMSRVNADISGDVRNVRTGEVLVSNLNIGGDVNVFRGDSWDVGGLTVGGDIKVFQLRGGGLNGDALFNQQTLDNGPKRIDIRGDLTGDLRWQGEAGRVSIDGDVEGAFIGDEQDAGARRFTAGDVRDSDVQLPVGARKLGIDSFVGSPENELVTLASRDIRVDGPFEGTLTVAEAFTLEINGDARFENFAYGTIDRVTIRGDVTDSEITNFTNVVGTDPEDLGTREFVIEGRMEDSTLNSQRDMGDFSVGAMIDAQVAVGFLELPAFDASASELRDDIVDESFGFDTFRVEGLAGESSAFVNSSLIVGEMGYLRIETLDPNNNGAAFGVSLLDYERIWINDRGLTPERANVPFGGDFQVRLGFETPIDAV